MEPNLRLPVAALVVSLTPPVLSVVYFVAALAAFSPGGGVGSHGPAFLGVALSVLCLAVVAWPIGLILSFLANGDEAKIGPRAKRLARAALAVSIGTGTLGGLCLAASIAFAIYQRAHGH